MKLHHSLLALPLAAAFLAGCSTEQRTLPAVQNSGEYALAQNNVDQAFADFREYTERAPGSGYGHLMLGKTYLAKDMPAHAREQFELAYTADPANPDVVESLCEALYQDKEYDALFRLLRQRVVEKATANDFRLMGRYARLTGDADEAQSALLTSARMDRGRSIAPQLELAEFYSSIGNADEAARRARMAYYISPDNDRVKRTLRDLGVAIGPATGLTPTERE